MNNKLQKIINELGKNYASIEGDGIDLLRLNEFHNVMSFIVTSPEMLKLLSLSMEQDWIRLEDELPEPETDVLCYFKSLHSEVCYVSNGTFRNEENLPVGKPTHWRPLPEPPKTKNS